MFNSRRTFIISIALAMGMISWLQPSVAGVVFREGRGVACGDVQIAVTATAVVIAREKNNRCISISLGGASSSEDERLDSSELRTLTRALSEVVLFDARLDPFHMRALSILFATVGRNGEEAREIRRSARKILRSNITQINTCLSGRGTFVDPKGQTNRGFDIARLECRFIDTIGGSKFAGSRKLNSIRIALRMGSEILIVFLPTRVR